MSSDGRYMYQPPINTNYDYTSYPPPTQSYDNSQVSQPPPPRQIRSTSSTQSQSPHQPYNPPPQAYPPPSTYGPGPGPYMTHPSQPPPPQWTGDNWAPYNQTYTHQHPPPPPPPPIPGPESAYAPLPSRQEPVSSPIEPRGYINSSHPDPRRLDERPPPPNIQPPSRRRDRESPPAASPGTPPGLDFMRMLHSYRLIIDDANVISSGPGRPTIEQLDRMLHSATQGAQTLEAIRVAAATGPAMLIQTRSPKEIDEPEDQAPSSASVPQNGVAGSSKPQKTEETSNGGQEGQTCLGCKATSTPEWRRGPLGPRTLCNACGLVYAKIIKRRVREQVSGKANGEHSQDMGEDSGEGDSEDDDEYDSQGRRSLDHDGGRDER